MSALSLTATMIRSALLFGTLLLFVTLTAPTGAGAADPDFQLYLLIGQSNMAGRGTVDAQSSPADPRVLMLNKERQWVPAADPLHFDKPTAGVGPGLAFGTAMAEAAPGKRIGLLPCAVGGSSITAWVPGATDAATRTHPYDDMLARVIPALTQGTLKGILWHQGESDRGTASAYAAELTALVTRLRQDLGAPAVPFVAGELALFKPDLEPSTTAFNAILHSLEGTLPAYAVVSAADLTDRGDQLHFDTPSARTLGVRYATAMRTLQSRTP
jgi:hypothetical protein